MQGINNMPFNTEELRFLTDTEFFFTRLKVTQKITDLLGETEQYLRKTIQEFSGYDCVKYCDNHGKIFKGENYRKLPYILLDFPRYFSADAIFAFRTLFWWGHGFSCTLHLQGKAYEEYAHLLRSGISRLFGKGYFIGVNHSPWEYHYGSDNYIPVESEPDHLLPENFLKISRRLVTERAGELPQFAGCSLNEVFTLLR